MSTIFAPNGVVAAGWNGGPGSADFNSNTIRAGILFVASQSAAMTGFKYWFNTHTGTITSGCQVDLFAVDANYRPTGASLATATFTPADTSLNTINWSVAPTVVAGTMYCIVIQNLLGTPGSNFFKPVFFPQSYNPVIFSNDSGTTWFSAVNTSSQFAALFENYSGTTYGPAMGLGGGLNGAIGAQLYNTSGVRTARQAVKVRFPYAVKLWGINCVGGNKTGTPTHQIVGEVSTVSASLATTPTQAPSANFAGNPVLIWWFDNTTVQTLAANTDYYVGVVPSGATAGDSSNYVRMSLYNTGSPNPTNVLGVVRGTYSSTASGNPSWTQDTSNEMSLTMYVEVVASGGGTVGFCSMG